MTQHEGSIRGADDPSVVLSEEQLRVGVTRVPYRRLRVAKRVVVEQQTITVDVRREELVVEELDLDGTARGADLGAASQPLVLVLSREVPDEVLMRTEPVEVVRVQVERTTRDTEVSAPLRREQVELRETGRD